MTAARLLVFGEYADIYDIRQAIEDNATVPIFYKMRLVKLLPDEEGIVEAERQLSAAAEADKEGQKIPDDIEAPLEDLAGADERLKLVAREIDIPTRAIDFVQSSCR